MAGTIGKLCRTCLVGVIALALCSEAKALWLGVRNRLPHPVVVQLKAAKDKSPRQMPQRLYPREMTWVRVPAGSVHLVTVSDARQLRSNLVRTKIKCGQEDVIYDITLAADADGNKFVTLLKTWQGVRGKQGH